MNHRRILALAITMFAATSNTDVRGEAVSQRMVHQEDQPSFYWDAKELQRRLGLAERVVGPALTPSESIDAHDGMTYLMGVADVMQGVSSCPTPNDRAGSATLDAVVKYIADHPDRLSSSAAIVVKDALHDAFPCQVKAASN